MAWISDWSCIFKPAISLLHIKSMARGIKLTAWSNEHIVAKLNFGFVQNKSSRHRRLTATADAPTMSSARHSIRIKTDSPSQHRPRQNRCDSSLNRNRVPQQKSSKPEPIWSQESATHSVVSSKSDLPSTQKRRLHQRDETPSKEKKRQKCVISKTEKHERKS